MGIVIYALAGIAGIAVFYLLARGYSLRVALITFVITNLAVIAFAGMMAVTEDTGYISPEGLFIVLMILFGGPLFLSGATGILLAWWANRKEGKSRT